MQSIIQRGEPCGIKSQILMCSIIPLGLPDEMS
jgi:hypothetical protein